MILLRKVDGSAPYQPKTSLQDEHKSATGGVCYSSIGKPKAIMEPNAKAKAEIPYSQ
jgi:hypothetical protein